MLISKGNKILEANAITITPTQIAYDFSLILKRLKRLARTLVKAKPIPPIMAYTSLIFIFNNESGHYMPPPKNLNYIKKILKKKYKFISERKDGVYKPYILGKGRGSEILGLKILTFEA